VYAIVNPSTGQLLVANAGHPQPVLVHNGVPTLLPHGDLLLGVTASSSFTLHERTLEPGDSFVLYTDGLVEIGRDIVKGTDLLLECVASGTTDAAALVEQLTFNRQQDDVAVLTVSVPSPQRVLHGESATEESAELHYML
jgi:serine phosphatase RsbU (regulator of sigma subunit)